jgi:hypothetical protein
MDTAVINERKGQMRLGISIKRYASFAYGIYLPSSNMIVIHYKRSGYWVHTKTIERDETIVPTEHTRKYCVR